MKLDDLVMALAREPLPEAPPVGSEPEGGPPGPAPSDEARAWTG